MGHRGAEKKKTEKGKTESLRDTISSVEGKNATQNQTKKMKRHRQYKG